MLPSECHGSVDETNMADKKSRTKINRKKIFLFLFRWAPLSLTFGLSPVLIINVFFLSDFLDFIIQNSKFRV